MQKLRLWIKNPTHLLGLIMAVSTLARLASAIYMGDTVVEMPGTYDQISYHALAQRVLGGYGFSFAEDWWPITAAGEPTAHWSYLYTFYLVLVYAIFGPHPLAARIIQALIFGLLQPYLTYQIGARLFDRAAGLTAALLTAVYAYFVYYGGALMTEPFYILAILLALDLSIRLATVPEAEMQTETWLSLGLACGLAILLRQVFLLMVPFFLLWIGWMIHRCNPTFSVLKLALPVVVIAVMILPFTVYNTARFGAAVLLNTNAGYAFFWGNHPYYGTDFQPILPSPMYRELIPRELRTLDEAALDKALLSLALQNIVADPGRYLLLSLSRIPDFFMFWPSASSGMVSNVSRVISFGILWPFMLAGIILAVKQAWTQAGEKWSAPVLLPILFMLLYSAAHILTWTLIRYRLPVDAVGLVFAGTALVDLDRRVFHIQQRLMPAIELSSPIGLDER